MKCLEQVRYSCSIEASTCNMNCMDMIIRGEKRRFALQKHTPETKRLLKIYRLQLALNLDARSRRFA